MSDIATASGYVEYVDNENPECVDNTPSSAPLSITVPISTVMLWRMEVRIPPGHAGLTGIALFDSGSPVIPWATSGTPWIIGNDDLLEYPYNKELGSSITLVYYNTSTLYTHGWQVRFIYTPMSLIGTNDEAVIVISPSITGT